MLKPHAVLGFGLWMILVDLVGIPKDWKVLLYVLTGAVLVFIYLFHLGKEVILRLASQEQSKAADTFTQNGARAPEAASERKNP